MAATLTTSEILAKELVFLDERKRSLDAAIKANEARVKDIRSEFDLASVKVRRDLEQLARESEQKREALRAQVEPLQNQVKALSAQVAREQANVGAINHETERALDERRKQIATLEAVIKLKQKSFDALASAVKTIKDKVGAL